jgi:CBS domain containing-hemolysin-like protein
MKFGSTIGIASIEDLLEEIVGKVWDGYDLKEKTVMPLGGISYVMQAYKSYPV